MIAIMMTLFTLRILFKMKIKSVMTMITFRMQYKVVMKSVNASYNDEDVHLKRGSVTNEIFDLYFFS